MDGLRKALIVANDLYEHEGLKHLLAPAADAQALAGVLGDVQIGGFEVQVVRNEPAHIIQRQIEDLFSDSRAEDVLLLHFSCHGLKSESGELFFAARDTRPNRLGSTAISADFVQRSMRASRSRSIVLLLDCCYGGAFSQGVTVRAAGDVNVLDSFPGGKLGGGRGRAVITASSAMEYAFEGDQLADDHSQRPSVFTSALVEGLATGDADRDQDGWVSLNELYDYVFDRVREQNPHQTPSRDVEMQGELYLARRSRPVTTPAPLPAELQQVIDHPLAGIRAGAVQELARLVRGRHAGLALAAKLALERLTTDDSRIVAAAAAEALAAVDPDQAPVRIGAPATVDREPTRAGERAPPPQEARTAGHIDATRDAAPRAEVPSAVDSLAVTPLPAPEPMPAPAAPDARSPETASGTARSSRRYWPFGRATGTDPTDPAAAATQVAPLRGPRHRRLVYVAGAAAVVAVAGTVAVLLLPDRNPSPPEAVHPAEGNFTATAPWRLVIRAPSNSRTGCSVTLTQTDGAEKLSMTGLYGTKSYQIPHVGNFRWEANDPGCLVIQRSGPGKAVLPFVQQAYTGDTDAFTAPKATGEITVEVLNFQGGTRCDFQLKDVADGRAVDFGTVNQGDRPLPLDTSGRSQVYLQEVNCAVRVSAR